MASPRTRKVLAELRPNDGNNVSGLFDHYKNDWPLFVILNLKLFPLAML